MGRLWQRRRLFFPRPAGLEPPFSHSKRNAGRVTARGANRGLARAFNQHLQGRWRRVEAKRDSMVRIEVHDTGVGVASDHLRDIFEAFKRLERARSDGLGLGLFIVSRAAQLLEQEIEVRSTVGRGSGFAVLANAVAYG